LLTLSYLLSIVRRWSLIIVVIGLACAAAVFLRYRLSPAQYEAQAKLQVASPQRDNVMIYPQTLSLNARDEMTVERNNFIEIAQSREVYSRTLQQLNLTAEQAVYTFRLSPLRDSDFIYASVRAADPALAARIVNTHIAAAIAYYGETKATPATQSKAFLGQRVAAVQDELSAALTAKATFETDNGFVDLTAAIATAQRAIDNLEDERERVAQNASASPNTNLMQLARLLQLRRADLQKLRALEPDYNVLTERVKQARANYEFLLGKYAEAENIENSIKQTGIIYLVEPASPPLDAINNSSTLFSVLALVGGLVFGLLLAIAIDQFKRLSKRRLAFAMESQSWPAKPKAKAKDESGLRTGVLDNG